MTADGCEDLEFISPIISHFLKRIKEIRGFVENMIHLYSSFWKFIQIR